MVPVGAFYLCSTLEDASQTPLTGRGCHGPSGPCYGRPGEQTRTTIESIHLFIKVGRDCRRLPDELAVSLSGPVHSFFARPRPPLSPFARLLARTALTHSLSFVA